MFCSELRVPQRQRSHLQGLSTVNGGFIVGYYGNYMFAIATIKSSKLLKCNHKAILSNNKLKLIWQSIAICVQYIIMFKEGF